MILILSACKNAEEKEVEIAVYDTSVIDQELQSLFKQTGSAGMGIAIFDEKQILFEKGYGLRNRDERLPYNTSTVQNIASISKVITGLTLLKAMEGKEISLNDDINMYLPFKVKNVLFPETPITIEHLVTHTSSIYDGDYYSNSYYSLEENYMENPSIDQQEIKGLATKVNGPSLTTYLRTTLEEIDTASATYGYVNYKPGSTYSYSNNGAGLIALIVESITGQNFKSYSYEHILKPLALENSTWEDVVEENHSFLYSTDKLRYPFYGLLTAADGAYRTNTHELALLGQELIKAHQGNGTLLNNQSYQTFYKKRLDEAHFKTEKSIASYKNDGFNKGVFITYERGGIGHSGGDPGVSTLLYFHTETHKGYLLLLNTDFNNDQQYEAFIKIAERLNEEIAKK
jgi:CubicO group peptidase (beta-lactamase class C family)